MSSWVRYCVAVYIGLLISGALARPPWEQATRAEPTLPPAPRVMGAPAPQTPDLDPARRPEA